MLLLVIFWVNQETQWQFYFSCCSCLSIDVVQELEIFQSAKLLIVTVTNNLLWKEHINDVVKKASKRLYFLVQFSKKGKAPLQRSSSFLYLRPLSKFMHCPFSITYLYLQREREVSLTSWLSSRRSSVRVEDVHIGWRCTDRNFFVYN